MRDRTSTRNTCFFLEIEAKMAHSPELQWNLIKNSSCFIVRRRNGRAVTFTTEPNNLKSKNAYKFNTLVNKKGVGVEAGPENKGVVLVTKRVKGSCKPAKMFSRQTLQRDRRRTYKSIRKFLGCSEYRQDLMELAVRRASAILASQRPRKKFQRGKKR